MSDSDEDNYEYNYSDDSDDDGDDMQVEKPSATTTTTTTTTAASFTMAGDIDEQAAEKRFYRNSPQAQRPWVKFCWELLKLVQSGKVRPCESLSKTMISSTGTSICEVLISNNTFLCSLPCLLISFTS